MTTETWAWCVGVLLALIVGHIHGRRRAYKVLEAKFEANRQKFMREFKDTLRRAIDPFEERRW